MERQFEFPQIKTRLEVKNEAGDDEATLFLYGVIREAYPWEEEGDCISAKHVRKELANLAGKDINVHLNSGGGDVFESIAIANLLKQHGGDISIYIDGLAGSGASIIAASGKKVYMPSNTMQMIHKAWSLVVGNADDLRKSANDLDKVDAAVKASYAARFIGTDEELENLIAEETWLTAEECLAFGLCDEIVSDDKEPEEETPKASVRESLFAKYKKTEEQRKADTTGAGLLNAFKQKRESE